MSQSDSTEQDNFTDGLRSALRASEKTLDASSVARLVKARTRAVATLTAPALPPRWLLPAAMAAAALVLTVTLRQFEQDPHGRAGLRTADTLELLTDDKDPQFYRDLEFYKWLEQHQRHA